MTMTRPGPAAIAPSGDLCEDSIGPLERALRLATGPVVIDLAEVTMLSAAAMRILVQARRRLGDVRLVNAEPFVARTLELCGLGDLVSRSRP
jgi:anti-anti-sigma factor